MKLFLATINVKMHSTTQVTAVLCIVFVQAFNRLAGYRMSNNGHLLIGTNQRPDHNHYDSVNNVLRGHRTTESLRLALIDWAQARYELEHSVELREVTEAERKWFMTIGAERYVSNLLEEISYEFHWSEDGGNKRERLVKVANSLRDRTNGRRLGGYVNYRSINMTAHAYKAGRDFCKMMGQRIREAIKLGDVSHCEEVFMDNYDMDSTLHHRVFEGMCTACNNNGLSLNVEELYCGHIGDRDGRARVDGRLRYYCQSCMENEDVVVYAQDTEEYMARDEAYYDDYNGDWLSCEPDSDDPDDNHRNTDRLMSYSTNALDHLTADSSFTSAPFGNFLMGVELEIVTRDSVNDAVEDVRDQLGTDYCICKSDGSLPDGGLEIVTAPRTLDEHIKRFSDWNISDDYNAWKNGRCGMHVHIDSRAFTSLTLGKFIVLMNAEGNAEFIRKIAGRHPLMDSQARSYCRTETQSELTNPSKALKGKSGDRYMMVNTANLKRNEANRLGVPLYDQGRYNTIELRIFRASLKKARLLAQLEFTHATVMFCRVASMRDLNGVSFLKWLKTTDNRYPHLADWYGVRRRPTAKGAEPTEIKCEDTVPPAPAGNQRHDTFYPSLIEAGQPSLDFIDREHLHAEYARVADTDIMYFPYSGVSRIIDANDVVYVLDPDEGQWRLQPVGTLANTNIDALII